jgi:triacylglycerol lipase
MAQIHKANGVDAMNIGSLLTRHARYRPDHIAVIFEQRRRSFRDFNQRVNRLANALLIILLLIGGAGGSTGTRQNHKSTLPSSNASIANTTPKPANRSPLQNDVGLTPHFRNWLAANGYSGYNFARDDAPGGSYGGKQNDSDAVVNQPVIFIHGNSDSALGTGAPFTGWTASINFFLSQGYKTSELYATTWGPADPALSIYQYHSKVYLTKIRAFIKAVKAYTGAAKVDVIAHSMGVTLARKAILGGAASDLMDGGDYDLGPPLTGAIDTFVGIAGSNRGLVTCYLSGPTTPACGDTNGFYPGYMIGFQGPFGVSQILRDINASSHYEGSYVYTIWSTIDEVIGYGCVVYGRYTPQIPGQNGERRFSSLPYGHINSKDLTGYYQHRMVKYHAAL